MNLKQYIAYLENMAKNSPKLLNAEVVVYDEYDNIHRSVTREDIGTTRLEVDSMEECLDEDRYNDFGSRLVLCIG